MNVYTWSHPQGGRGAGEGAVGRERKSCRHLQTNFQWAPPGGTRIPSWGLGCGRHLWDYRVAPFCLMIITHYWQYPGSLVAPKQCEWIFLDFFFFSFCFSPPWVKFELMSNIHTKMCTRYQGTALWISINYTQLAFRSRTRNVTTTEQWASQAPSEH